VREWGKNIPKGIEGSHRKRGFRTEKDSSFFFLGRLGRYSFLPPRTRKGFQDLLFGKAILYFSQEGALSKEVLRREDFNLNIYIRGKTFRFNLLE